MKTLILEFLTIFAWQKILSKSSDRACFQLFVHLQWSPIRNLVSIPPSIKPATKLALQLRYAEIVNLHLIVALYLSVGQDKPQTGHFPRVPSGEFTPIQNDAWPGRKEQPRDGRDPKER